MAERPASPGGSSDSEMEIGQTSSADEGRWGEQGGDEHVSRRAAMEDFEEMKRELTRLSLQRSKSMTRGKTHETTPAEAEEGSAESVTTDLDYEKEFELDQFLKEGHLERRTTAGEAAKRVGVVFKNLTVTGAESSTTFVKTLPDAVIGTFGPDLYNIITRFVPFLRFGKTPPTRPLIRDFTGAVRDKEIMLVLGRPGSGCTTFLKTIANDRSSFAGISGEVSYGGIPAEEQDKYFRGEVNYNPEDDQHFPALNVWQTLKFSLMNKTRKNDQASIPIVVDALMKMFGITHTKYTPVGNEFLRGVSGGERKRVSIAETLSTKSTVVCWDNSTRGLDANTALDYAKSLRVMTDVSNRTTLVTLYQAGESIYELMDKVLLIEEGRMLYQGPASDAKAYFEDLGFHCPERSTTADFLTSLCDPTAREFKQGREASTPKTPEELEEAFRKSEAYQLLLADVNSYETKLKETNCADTMRFKKTVGQSKSKTVSKQSSYTVSFMRQVAACTKREFWLLWGDKTSLYTKFFIIIANALIVSSLFYGQSLDTSGSFARGGSLFFSILFLGWLQMTELMKGVSGRTIINRHRDYAFYRPSAVSIARVVLDFPLIFCMVAVFTIIVYFMTGLDVDVSKFFIYALFVYTNTICITAMYRMFAALSPTIDDAVRFGGISLNILLIFVGYVISKPALISDSIWFGWLTYVNPISYAYEAVIANEFSGRTMECAPSQLVPQGPGVDPEYQACTLPGTPFGSRTVTGDHSRSHLWRNFGAVIGFTVLYILVTVIAVELLPFVNGGGGATVFKKSKRTKQMAKREKGLSTIDEEKGGEQTATKGPAPFESETSEQALHRISTSQKVFTWTDIEYTVPYQGGERKLLNKVSGYAKPGHMIALMGASGAGKTTLLNTLGQRQKVGVVSGDMLLDGRPLATDFQRGTGFCEQMDLHDSTATIREALEFSAILRQDRHVPKADKLRYVDQIVDLLELGEIQDAIVGSLGVEQRKRLTIGVELAAKPDVLLFLDEPTSGLDSQSAYSIVRFLKKLSQAGQAIICTIHQPSSILIQQFEMILALNPGGNTFYFGPVGESGSGVMQYFADRGFTCPPSKNIAEFILETAARTTRKDGSPVNWDEEWRNSEQNREIMAEIRGINAERSQMSFRAEESSQPQIEYEYAAPVALQTIMLTKRVFRQQWRDSSYLYGKLFVSVLLGVFNGFTFWQLGNSIASMQNRMFSIFLIILIPPVVINSILPKFYMNRSLWEARELPGRIYGWVAFCTANVVSEIPAAIVTGLVYWLLWYYPVGLPTDSSTAGYVFLMSMLFFFFQASWGQWICAFAPSFTVIANVLPFFFVMVNLFNGIIVPYDSNPVFWRYWMYYINPTTWWIRGVLSATLPTIPVICSPIESTHFNPPPGQTCAQYAGAFVSDIARSGYLTNPDAREDCSYCPYKDGREYMHSLNVQDGDKWMCFGIFLAFVVSNWALVYAMIYFVRVRGWSFGFGMVMRGMERGVKGLKRIVLGK
ncbi:hypothetical protein FQN54_008566 [Arachnomyces sp. PD_36]|nr:hypothetical protein FQN54_008566 [Arachnomyces sp. PD_36]